MKRKMKASTVVKGVVCAVLLLVETVTGKHLSRKHEAIVHFVGLILLLGLIVLLTGRDILRLFGVNL